MNSTKPRRNPLTPLATRQEAHRIAIAVFLVMFAAVGVALFLGPVVSYHCEAGELGVRCEQTPWYGGMVRGEPDRVEGIRSATSSQSRVRSALNASVSPAAESRCASRRSRDRHTTVTRDTLVLLGGEGQLLREFDMDSVIGNSAADIAQQINALAEHRRSEPFTRWMAPLTPWLTASILLLITAAAVPLIYLCVEGAAQEFGTVKRATATTAALLAVVWIVLALGEAPDTVAGWLGMSGG
jgi:hypothetical protein